MGKRGRPPKDAENTDGQKEHSSPTVYLGKNFGRWEEHRVACGGGVGSHQEFARHLLALHCEHCPRSPGAAPSGVKKSKGDGDVEDYDTDREKFSITLDGDCARQWRRIQRLAGYEAAELEYLYWLLSVAEQMLGWKLPTSGTGDCDNQESAEGSANRHPHRERSSSPPSPPYPISAPQRTVLPEYRVVSTQSGPDRDASSDDNTLPPVDDNDDVDVKPTLVADKNSLSNYTLKWADETTTPYMTPTHAETRTSRLRPNDEIKPEGHPYETEGSGRMIQKHLHLDTFNPNTTSQVQASDASVHSNIGNLVEHESKHLGVNRTLQENDCSRSPYGDYVDKAVVVLDKMIVAKHLDHTQQDQIKEGPGVFYADEMDLDSDGSSDMEDPKDVDYTPKSLSQLEVGRSEARRTKVKWKSIRSTEKKTAQSLKRKIKSVRRAKERTNITSKKILKETAKTKSRAKYLRQRYFCKECNRNFKDPYYYKIHNHKLHGAERPQKEKLCTECGKVFGCNTTLRTHQRMVHAEVVPRMPCPVCKHQVRKFDFNRHMRMSHSGLKYLCDICGGELKSKKGLSNHKRDVHLVPELQVWKEGDGIPPTGPLVFECDICGKVLKNRNNLLDHKKVIHNPPSHYCPWSGCEKVFKNKKNLKTHMLLHTGEMPMKCKLCDYRCRQHSSLNWHMQHKHNCNTRPSATTSRSKLMAQDGSTAKISSNLSKESGQPRQPIDFAPSIYYPMEAAPQWPVDNKPFTM